MVLRVFFYICGAVCLLCSFVLSRIPGERSPEMLQQVPKFSFSSFGEVFRDLAHSKKFLSYFICIMFFFIWAGISTGACGTSARCSMSA